MKAYNTGRKMKRGGMIILFNYVSGEMKLNMEEFIFNERGVKGTVKVESKVCKVFDIFFYS